MEQFSKILYSHICILKHTKWRNETVVVGISKIIHFVHITRFMNTIICFDLLILSKLTG